MKFWNMVKNEETKEEELHIDGTIQMEQGFWDWLRDKPDRSATGIEKAIKSFAGKNLVIWINSNGGSCPAASVIYSALMEHKKTGGRVIAKINTAISAASVVAMAADEIKMSPTGIMMIHNPWTVAEGEVKDMQKAIEILSQVKETIINAYQHKTGKTRKEISDMMDAETWMSASRAIELGFADETLYTVDDVTEEMQNGIMRGAKSVYNSVMEDKFTEKLLEMLNNENKRSTPTEEDLLYLQNKIKLEKARF